MNDKPESIIKRLVSEIAGCPPGTPMMLTNAHSESILKVLVEHYPPSSPIIFQCTIPAQTIKNIVKHTFHHRGENARSKLVLIIDPESAVSQVATLVKTLKSFESILFMATSLLSANVLQALVRGLGHGQGIVFDHELSDIKLRNVIPLLPADTRLNIMAQMHQRQIAMIAELVPFSVRVSLVTMNFPLQNAITLAKHLTAGRYLCIRQDTIPTNTAQALANALNEGVILYCASGDIAYLRALSAALNPGAILMFHPSILFTDVINAIRYMRPGTILKIENELDETQIDLLITAVGTKDIGIVFNEDTVSPEICDQIMTGIRSRPTSASPETDKKIKRVISFIHDETQRVTAANIAKAQKFFEEQLGFQGPFYSYFKLIMSEALLNQYEILVYFINKHSKIPVAYHEKLETAVTYSGFKFLVSFEEELHRIIDARQLSSVVIDRAKSCLLKALDALEQQVLSQDFDALVAP